MWGGLDFAWASWSVWLLFFEFYYNFAFVWVISFCWNCFLFLPKILMIRSILWSEIVATSANAFTIGWKSQLETHSQRLNSAFFRQNIKFSYDFYIQLFQFDKLLVGKEKKHSENAPLIQFKVTHITMYA